MEYEARGFNFDPKSLVPPPVPDDQNFAATPFWKHLEQYKKNDGRENFKVALFTARDTAHAAERKSGNWLNGAPRHIPNASLFAGAEAELADLYAAAEKPLCRFHIDYTNNTLPYAYPIPQASPLLGLGQALHYHALIALDQGRTDVTAGDITLTLRLASASMEEPLLIMGLVGNTMKFQALSIIWQGIESHTWSDEQLTRFQDDLSRVSTLNTYQTDIKGELLISALPTLDMVEYHPEKIKKATAGSSDSDIVKPPDISSIHQIIPPPVRFLFTFCTRNAFDNTRYEACHIFIDQLIPVVDVKNDRLFPDRLPDLQKIENGLSFSISNLLLKLFLSGLQNLPVYFGQTQEETDLARVACGLERYRLANQKYPATLAELAPKFIDSVPHDICNGEPLHYRVEADGNYTLYSVGFNGTDDGGKIVMKAGSDTAIDPKQGDWVWPRLKN